MTEPTYVHVYPRNSDGYLDFSRTICGLGDDVYAVDPTAAELRFWVAGVDNACVCIDCVRRRKPRTIDIHTEMSLYTESEESEEVELTVSEDETSSEETVDATPEEPQEPVEEAFEEPPPDEAESEFTAPTSELPEDDISQFMEALG